MSTCSYCSSDLPDEALFCGECGRAVPGRIASEPARSEPARSESLSTTVDGTQGAVHMAASCDSCGATLQPGDIFCGECGDVIRPLGLGGGEPRDTVAIEPIPEWDAEEPAEPDPVRAAPADVPTPIDGFIAPFVARVEPQGERSQELGQRLSEILDDVEDTRIVQRSGAGGERFVLQFSTGESVRVAGSGLIGRNPRSEPAEFVDQFVRVTDPTRSVSKTHLEFGQENGAFWVRDRYSGNGSIVREPERPPVRCEPGRRYLVPRGTRVDIADQFFVVS